MQVVVTIKVYENGQAGALVQGPPSLKQRLAILAKGIETVTSSIVEEGEERSDLWTPR